MCCNGGKLDINSESRVCIYLSYTIDRYYVVRISFDINHVMEQHLSSIIMKVLN